MTSSALVRVRYFAGLADLATTEVDEFPTLPDLASLKRAIVERRGQGIAKSLAVSTFLCGGRRLEDDSPLSAQEPDVRETVAATAAGVVDGRVSGGAITVEALPPFAGG